jgi:hypothetical protein
MPWEIEYSDEFEQWWDGLDIAEQDSIDSSMIMLIERGPELGRPHADKLQGAKYSNLKELRVQHEGRPYRILFVFDPRRVGYLLIGGDKTGNPRWYDEFIPVAEKIYAQHLKEIDEAK